MSKELVVDLIETFPVQSIESNCLIHGDESVTVGFRIIKSPEIYSLKSEDAIEIEQLWVNVLKLLPKKSTLHKQDFFYVNEYTKNEDSLSWIKKKNEDYYFGRGILNHYSNIYITFTNDNPIKRDLGMLPYFLRPSYLLNKKNEGKTADFIKTIKTAVDQFSNIINSSEYLKIKRLSNLELGNALYDFYNCSFENPCDNFSNKIVQPILDENGYLKLGGKYLGIVSMSAESEVVHSLGRSKVASNEIFEKNLKYKSNINIKTGLVHPVGLGLPINHILNTIITVYDNEEVTKHLQNVHGQLKLAETIGNSRAKEKRKLITQFSDEVLTKNYQCCKVGLNVILVDNNLERLEKNQGIVQGAFFNMREAESYIENKCARAIFEANIPSNAKYYPSTRTMITTTEHAVSYLNKETLKKSDPVGYTFVDLYGRPVVIDMWDTSISSAISNRNKIIIGPPGKGKSFLMNYFHSQSYIFGNHIILIDIGHSYRNLCELFGGKYFDSSDKKSFRFNLFLCPKDEKGHYNYKGIDKDEETGKIDFIKSAILCIWKGDNKEFQESQIRQVVEQDLTNMIVGFYKHINENSIFPTIDEFINYSFLYDKALSSKGKRNYVDCVELEKLLEPYKENGEYGYLLNAKDEIDIMNDRFIVFDLENVSKSNRKLFMLMSLILMDLILKKIQLIPSLRKSFFIDEALDFLLEEIFALSIAYVFRTVRKYEGEIGVITQNINFFRGLPSIVKDSIIGGSDTVILLPHSQQGIDDLISFGTITKEHEESMRILEVGMFFIKMGKKYGVLKCEVSEENQLLFSSWKSEKEAIAKIKEENNMDDTTSAIDQYLIIKKQQQ